MRQVNQPKVLALCTTLSGLDAVNEVLRQGLQISAIAGLHPKSADPEKVSNWTDIRPLALANKIPYCYVNDYSLRNPEDKKQLMGLEVDIIWVTGWQRLIPAWLINHCRYGTLGVHGSPDGIHGGRGRSPQNWALMLGITHFDLSLFKITPGVDNGPILTSKTIYYNEYDDIATSHHRVALATAEMIREVLLEPRRLNDGVAQP